MKKFLALMLAILTVFTLVGCSNNDGGTDTDGGEDTSGDEHYDIVFLADLGSIYDGGFNEYSYKGIEKYAEEAGLTYTYLQPAGNDDQSRITIFQQAAEQMTANMVVAVGYLWDAALLQCVPEYPDIKVIYADADNLYNIDVDYDGTDDSIEHSDNLAMIKYKEQECGWLAGYTVVMDGYRKLGFFGGMAVPAVIRFGYGFLEGAEAAAAELGLEEGSLECKYYYTGTFDASPDLVTFVSNWYASGTEIVFSCGGTIVNSVIKAAQDGENRMIVGVDNDEYYTRAVDGEDCVPQIVTSAMKDMEGSIYTAVKAGYESEADWKEYTDNCTTDGIIDLGYAEGGACIAAYRAENWKTLTQEQYDAAHTKLVEIASTLKTDADGENGAPIDGLKYVKVEYITQ